MVKRKIYSRETPETEAIRKATKLLRDIQLGSETEVCWFTSEEVWAEFEYFVVKWSEQLAEYHNLVDSEKVSSRLAELQAKHENRKKAFMYEIFRKKINIRYEPAAMRWCHFNQD